MKVSSCLCREGEVYEQKNNTATRCYALPRMLEGCVDGCRQPFLSTWNWCSSSVWADGTSSGAPHVIVPD